MIILTDEVYNSFKGKYHANIPYNKHISDLIKEDGKYYRVLKNGEKVCIEARQAALDIIGIQTHFLLYKGNITDTITAVNDPRLIFEHLTRENGKPLLNTNDTLSCLKDLVHGMMRFNNKNCMNCKPAFGIGIMAYLLAEPYLGTPDINFYELFYQLISLGTFALQMRRKPLALSLYKGLYAVWPTAQYFHKEEFSLESVKSCCMNIMECKDVFDDPLHDPNQYPKNMYHLNIDGLIMTRAALYEVVQRKDYLRSHGMSQYLFSLYDNAFYYTKKLITEIIPFYKARCDYECLPATEKASEDDPYIQHSKSYCFWEEGRNWAYSKYPHLSYIYGIAESCKDNWLFFISNAERAAITRYENFDSDCPILGERTGRPKFRFHFRQHPLPDKAKTAIKLIIYYAILGLIVLKVGRMIYDWGGSLFFIFIGGCMIIGYPLYICHSAIWRHLNK